MGKNGLTAALANRIGTTESLDAAYDAMFGLAQGNETDKIVELDLDSLCPHPKDPFKPYSDEKLEELAESIHDFGLIEPIVVRSVVRPDDDIADGVKYEILSGKNRANAERLSGRKKIKSIIRDVDDDTALLIITDANLKHRETLLPSEKGWAYRLQMEAITKQGERRDLGENSTSVQNEQELSRTVVAENNNVKDSEIHRSASIL